MQKPYDLGLSDCLSVPKLPGHNKHVKLKISRLLKQQVIIDKKVSKIEMMTSLEFYISDQKLRKLIFNSGNDVLKPKYIKFYSGENLILKKICV